MIEDLFARRFAGRDPFQIESLWRESYGSGFSLRPDLSLMGVISGLEMACWDIIGKAVEQPIYNLLGGKVHERLRSYTYLYPAAGEGDEFYHDADRSARARRRVRGAGIHRPQVRSHRRILRLRSAATHPGSARAHGAAGAPGARSGRDDAPICCSGRMVSSPPRAPFAWPGSSSPTIRLWFEEPVPPEMPEQMAIVARGTSIPIATGERLTTKYEFARVLGERRRQHHANEPRAGSAACSRRKRSRRWPKCTTRKSRRISTAARWWAPPTSRSPPARPIS